MSSRTSATHPLLIAEVAGAAGGRVGITFCPGKKQASAMSGSWDRDLGVDLDVVRAWGATAVLTLLEEQEIAELGVEAMGREVAARGMAWHHLPIRDVSVPTATFEAAYDLASPDIHRRLANGEKVLVHCKGGLGRAGMVAARLLVETGVSPEDAIERVRAARPKAIETKGQERYVRALGSQGAGAAATR